MQFFQNHIPFSLIADIAEGRVTPDEQIQAHMAVCQHCSSELAWLNRTLLILRTDATEAPNERVVGEIKAQFRAFKARRAVPRPGLLAALLRFDSARMAPAFGLRNAASAERQLLYSAGTYEIDLRVAPAGDRWAVAGQILSEPAGESGRAELHGPADAAVATLSQEQEFIFQPVRAGRYQLTISLSDAQIVLNDVDLGV
jgi:hypothetical protein